MSHKPIARLLADLTLDRDTLAEQLHMLDNSILLIRRYAADAVEPDAVASANDAPAEGKKRKRRKLTAEEKAAIGRRMRRYWRGRRKE